MILYYDERLQKRFPGLFSLTNNKKEKGYEFLFNKIYEIITVNNTINLNLKSYTVDFESGLINATKKILQKVRCIGFYYHNTRAIKEEAREMKLLTPDKYEKTEELLKELYTAPFIYYKDKNYINSICIKFEKNYKFLENYIAYYKKQWFKYFENGMLDYSKITKGQRSNRKL